MEIHERRVNPTPPEGMMVRAPTQADAQAVTDFIILCDLAEHGVPDYAIEDLLAEWRRPGFDLATDAWLVLTPAGQIVGYTDVWAIGDQIAMTHNSYVHPEFRGRGMGGYLLDLAETWTRAYVANVHGGGPVTLTNMVSSEDEAAQRLLEQRGFAPVRHTWVMEIDLDGPPPAPVWPEGVVIRTFVPGQDDRAVHALVEAAFQDSRADRIPIAFEPWENWMIKRADFDPSLWTLAMSGDAIVGTALCFDYPDRGWVRQLAVRRDARRQGLGLALLQHAFGEFYRRGKRKVGLGVDANNLTGATRLYERAGMWIARRYDTYGKVMRET
jgi:mycothiol synthase